MSNIGAGPTGGDAWTVIGVRSVALHDGHRARFSKRVRRGGRPVRIGAMMRRSGASARDGAEPVAIGMAG